MKVELSQEDMEFMLEVIDYFKRLHDASPNFEINSLGRACAINIREQLTNAIKKCEKDES